MDRSTALEYRVRYRRRHWLPTTCSQVRIFQRRFAAERLVALLLDDGADDVELYVRRVGPWEPAP
jgi:uncharacterized protein involved in type VI secretion and phage assembly